MGESTCLMHSLSFSPGMPNESNNHGNHALNLGDSVSFGRFTSESLAWEKWSTFPHKRYVEEAKSYAQPGSVAQKKAFFEAHYKKIAAQKAAAAAEAALLEQEKVKSKVEERVFCDSEPRGIPKLPVLQTMVLHKNKVQPAGLNLKMFVNEKQQIITRDSSKVIDNSSGVNLVEPQIEKIVVAADVKNKKMLDNIENVEDTVSVSEDSKTSQTDRPLLEVIFLFHKSNSNTDQEVLQPKIRRKPVTPFKSSSSMSRKHSRIPPSPAKYVASKKENIITPKTKNSIDSIDKKKAAPRSLYTLMNSGSVKESCKLNSTVVRKTESTKLAPTTPSHITPSKVTNKQQLGTPSIRKRMETPSAVGSKTPGQKWHIFSAVSKSLSAYKNKLQPPTVSMPFNLRTEERAAQRKQKLEEKFNEKEAQKVQMQTTLKEKADTEFRRLRQSFCFKARPLPSFYNQAEIPNSPSIKKTPQANLKSLLTPARKPPTTTSQPSSIKKSSRRLWKNNDQNPTTHPLASIGTRINHENISPNIQLNNDS